MDPRHQAFPGQRILWMWEKRIAWRNSSLGQKQLTAANPATPGPAHREQRETVMCVCVFVSGSPVSKDNESEFLYNALYNIA